MYRITLDIGRNKDNFMSGWQNRIQHFYSLRLTKMFLSWFMYKYYLNMMQIKHVKTILATFIPFFFKKNTGVIFR